MLEMEEKTKTREELRWCGDGVCQSRGGRKRGREDE